MLAANPIQPLEHIAPTEHDTDQNAAAPTTMELDGLSTDYLNHFSGALMLIEMASYDDAIVQELSAWQPISYKDYFAASQLRRAGSAIAAYDALPEQQRTAFEQIVQAMDKLVLAAVFALQPPCHQQNIVLIAEVIGPALRRLIDRAAAFLNGGNADPAPSTEDEAQAMVDRLIG